MKKITPLKIVLIFLTTSQLWIILTDLLVAEIATSPQMFTRLSIVKGGLYVAVAGLFLYWLVSRYAVERNKIEEALRRSELEYRLLHESLTEAVATVNMAGRFIKSNAAFDALVGYAAEDLLALSYEDLTPEKWHAMEAAILKEQILARGYSEVYEKEYRRRDGAVFPVELRAFLLQDDAKQPIGMWAIVRDITERRRAAEALQASERIFHNLFNNSEVAMFRTRVDGSEILNANDKFFELFGYTRDELIGKPSVIHWADPGQREEMVRRLKADGRVIDFECRMLTKKGDVCHCITSLNLYAEEAVLEGSIIDITARKMAEESLRENQERLDLALQAANLGVWRLEVKENKRYLDELTCQILGIDSRTFTGSAEEFYAVVHPDDKEMIITFFAKVIEQDVPYDLTYRAVWPGKSIHYVRSRGRLVRDDAGQPARLNGIIWDVTEQHLFEKELQEKETKYRTLFESANDGIFISDKTGFIDCNQKGAQMYGLTREQLIGRSPIELAPERLPNGQLSSDVGRQAIQAVLKGRPQTFEWQALHSSGRPFDVEIILSRLEMNGKRYVQAIFRDISERKRLEQEHLKAEKLESIGTLAGGIAHDFNNLLQGIFGFISLARINRDDQEKSLWALEEAEKALRMSVQLTNQLLTFSKGGKPVKKLVALETTIENAAKFALSGSRVSFRLALEDPLWPVEVDEGQIGQVIQNIVLNADQAMPDGGQVEIFARNIQAPVPDRPQDLKEGKYVEISVKDSGIGISEQHLHKIFDPYFTTKEKGSGLGLATCYSIIKNHNGIIDVKSQSGTGTTITIYLPATNLTVKETSMPAPAASGRKGKILVMDDEEFVLSIAQELLRALGHTADFSVHGEDALEKYRQAQLSGQRFDAVILDMTIRGGMGGFETLSRLFEIDPNVKAIVSSGYSDDAAVASYERQGFKSFLKKPYKLEDLQQVLNTVLEA